MRRFDLHVMRVLAVLIALADGALLSFLFVWLVLARGYVACGRAVLDSPDGLSLATFFLTLPAIILICAIAVIRDCSRRLAFR